MPKSTNLSKSSTPQSRILHLKRQTPKTTPQLAPDTQPTPCVAVTPCVTLEQPVTTLLHLAQSTTPQPYLVIECLLQLPEQNLRTAAQASDLTPAQQAFLTGLTYAAKVLRKNALPKTMQRTTLQHLAMDLEAAYASLQQSCDLGFMPACLVLAQVQDFLQELKSKTTFKWPTAHSAVQQVDLKELMFGSQVDLTQYSSLSELLQKLSPALSLGWQQDYVPASSALALKLLTLPAAYGSVLEHMLWLSLARQAHIDLPISTQPLHMSPQFDFDAVVSKLTNMQLTPNLATMLYTLASRYQLSKPKLYQSLLKLCVRMLSPCPAIPDTALHSILHIHISAEANPQNQNPQTILSAATQSPSVTPTSTATDSPLTNTSSAATQALSAHTITALTQVYPYIQQGIDHSMLLARLHAIAAYFDLAILNFAVPHPAQSHAKFLSWVVNLHHLSTSQPAPSQGHADKNVTPTHALAVTHNPRQSCLGKTVKAQVSPACRQQAATAFSQSQHTSQELTSAWSALEEFLLWQSTALGTATQRALAWDLYLSQILRYQHNCQAFLRKLQPNPASLMLQSLLHLTGALRRSDHAQAFTYCQAALQTLLQQSPQALTQLQQPSVTRESTVSSPKQRSTLAYESTPSFLDSVLHDSVRLTKTQHQAHYAKSTEVKVLSLKTRPTTSVVRDNEHLKRSKSVKRTEPLAQRQSLDHTVLSTPPATKVLSLRKKAVASPSDPKSTTLTEQSSVLAEQSGVLSPQLTANSQQDKASRYAPPQVQTSVKQEQSAMSPQSMLSPQEENLSPHSELPTLALTPALSRLPAHIYLHGLDFTQEAWSKDEPYTYLVPEICALQLLAYLRGYGIGQNSSQALVYLQCWLLALEGLPSAHAVVQCDKASWIWSYFDRPEESVAQYCLNLAKHGDGTAMLLWSACLAYGLLQQNIDLKQSKYWAQLAAKHGTILFKPQAHLVRFMQNRGRR